MRKATFAIMFFVFVSFIVAGAPPAFAGATILTFHADGAEVGVVVGVGYGIATQRASKDSLIKAKAVAQTIGYGLRMPGGNAVDILRAFQKTGEISNLQIRMDEPKSPWEQFGRMINNAYKKCGLFGEQTKTGQEEVSLLKQAIVNVHPLAKKMWPLALPQYSILQLNYAISLLDRDLCTRSLDPALAFESVRLIFYLYKERPTACHFFPPDTSLSYRRFDKALVQTLGRALAYLSYRLLDEIVEGSPQESTHGLGRVLLLNRFTRALALYPQDTIDWGFPGIIPRRLAQGDALIMPRDEIVADLRWAMGSALLKVGRVRAAVGLYSAANKPLELSELDKFMEQRKQGAYNKQEDIQLAESLSSLHLRAQEISFSDLMLELFPQNPWDSFIEPPGPSGGLPPS